MIQHITGRRVLLVGEGDFSFTVSLVSQLSDVQANAVTSSSIETTQTVKKHKTAEQNMSWLKQKGVDVQLETDATQLHCNAYFKDQKFDRIVFNFPHAGGKSNNKKNRKLLNDFFCSAVCLLETEGQILMTLCKGQGGTPADSPMREWHDSWQVVSMAANAGLLLKEIIPFVAEEFEVYTSTGFRSQDKRFNTHGSLTHMFGKGSLVVVPDKDDGTDTVDCGAYINSKLSKKMYETDHRPLFLIKKQLELAFKEEFGVEQFSIKKRSPILAGHFNKISLNTRRAKSSRTELREINCYHQPMKFSLSESVDGIMDENDISSFIGCLYFNQPIRYYTVSDDCERNCQESKSKQNNAAVNLGATKDDKKENCNFKSKENASKTHHLRVSLLEHVDEIVKSTTDSGQCCLLTGDVYRSCPISSTAIPVRHEMLGVVNFPCNLSHDIPCDLLDSTSHSQTSEDVIDDGKIKSSNSCMVKKMFTCLNKAFCDKLKFCFTKDITYTKPRYLWKLGSISLKHTCIQKEDNKECNLQYDNLEQIARDNKSQVDSSLSDIAVQEPVSQNYDSNAASEPRDDKTHVENLVDGMENLSNDEDEILLDDDSESYFNTSTTDKHGNLIVGYVWSLTSCKNSEPFTSLIFLLDLDLVAMNMFKIPQIRLLWTEEKPILKQFEKLDDFCPVFKSISLYPVRFTHDMSFWENPDIVFDELAYYGVIRDVGRDSVVSVTLIDSYCDKTANRKSRCYRLEFQSFDKVLSYDTSWKLQSLIRLEVAKRLGVILR